MPLRVRKRRRSSSSASCIAIRSVPLAALPSLTRRNADSLSNVVRDARTLPIAKARAAKLVQTLLGFFSVIPDGNATQIAMTKENADWARSEKRIFLAQSLEIRLVSLCARSFIRR